MSFVSSIGTNLPRLRLSRAAIATATGWLSGATGGKGSRTLAFWDEDSLTMAVAAARDCLSHAGCDRAAVEALTFATATPVFATPQSGALIHAALRLDPTCIVQDHGGTQRATLAALHAALEAGRPALIAGADLSVEPAGSAAEQRCGDGGAAVLVGLGAPLLRYCGGISVSSPFVDRYRAAGDYAAVNWEERWIREAGLLDQMPQAIHSALARANLSPHDIHHFVMPSPVHGGAKAVAEKARLTSAHLASDLIAECGDIGNAHALAMLANTLAQAKAGERILVAQFGQGVTALIFETTDAVATFRPSLPGQVARGIEENAYLKLPIFRGQLDWDRGLRARTPINEALSVAYRRADALLGFIGGRCRETGAVQFPPSRLSVADGVHLDSQEPWPLADRLGTIVTTTADRLAFSRSPPNCYGLVDFDGGGRLMMDFTDPDADQLHHQARVAFTFRLKDLDETNGWRRYFWKAVSVPSA